MSYSAVQKCCVLETLCHSSRKLASINNSSHWWIKVDIMGCHRLPGAQSGGVVPFLGFLHHDNCDYLFQTWKKIIAWSGKTAYLAFVNIGESYYLSTNRVIGREAITLSYIYKSAAILWVDQVQSLGITPMADTLPNYPTVQYLPVAP